MIRIAPNKQTPAKKNIIPWKPTSSDKLGKYFVRINANIQMSDKQIDEPKSFKFSGKISEMTTNGNDKMPQDAASKANAKLAIGIQL